MAGYLLQARGVDPEQAVAMVAAYLEGWQRPEDFGFIAIHPLNEPLPEPELLYDVISDAVAEAMID